MLVMCSMVAEVKQHNFFLSDTAEQGIKKLEND